ncbi:DUF4230 domain-containing protein [Moorena bouillonii]|uniref:DUF4230 domain-containing protein n=2 Tax=Moorena TaxID=1155738 RepID=A0A1U7MYU7_9CYAN|nr:DUF4230 domain-containing protein [Moorena bouillonii]OLT58824.1 hypothetical protein BJP37_06955 [Moorena bouillonii PNG]
MKSQHQKHQLLSIISSIPRGLILMSTGGMILTTLIIGVVMWRTSSRLFEQVNGLFDLSQLNLSQPEPEVDVRNVVVNKVRNVSELTTAVFSMEAVVPTRQDRNLGQYRLASTTLLYIAYGEVRAGVDLGKLSVDDVKVSNDSIQVQLPAPQLLDSKIDVTRSQVYDYNRGFLGLGPDVAPQLQMLAQQETLRKIQATACQQGVLEQANQRAQLVVTNLLMTAGYKTVDVKLQPSSPSMCLTAFQTPS